MCLYITFAINISYSLKEMDSNSWKDTDTFRALSWLSQGNADRHSSNVFDDPVFVIQTSRQSEETEEKWKNASRYFHFAMWLLAYY